MNNPYAIKEAQLQAENFMRNNLAGNVEKATYEEFSDSIRVRIKYKDGTAEEYNFEVE